MIGKGKSISHTRASMSYGWNQEKDAEVVLKEFLHGDSPAEITKEFKMLQDQNYHCTKNTLSFNLIEIRTEIKRRHDLTMKQFQPKSFDAYVKAMEANGVKVIPTINKQNKLQGFRFEFDGHNLKGSEVHRNMSMGNIGKEMSGIQGKSILKDNNVSIKLAGKVVDLTPNLALKITKFIIKRAIDKGMDIGY